MYYEYVPCIYASRLSRRLRKIIFANLRLWKYGATFEYEYNYRVIVFAVGVGYPYTRTYAYTCTCT